MMNNPHAPFTMDEALRLKSRQRQRLRLLPIDAKIRMVEEMRRRVRPIRDWRKSAAGNQDTKS